MCDSQNRVVSSGWNGILPRRCGQGQQNDAAGEPLALNPLIATGVALTQAGIHVVDAKAKFGQKISPGVA